LFHRQPIEKVMKLIALLLPLAALAQSLPFGSPVCTGPNLEPADRAYFFLCYDGIRKAAAWVGYTLTQDRLAASATRRSHFRQDYELTGPAATDRDYRFSGFSRGHLAPAADFRFSPEAVRATFLLSNAIPQKQSVNARQWAGVEAAVRRLAREAECVYVFTGTLFEGEPHTIGAGRVAVPSHTYKVALAIHGDTRILFAVIVPNRDRVSESLAELAVSVDEVERRSGLDFFAELEDAEEERLESQVTPLTYRAR
jgi:endonuclease G